MSYETPRVVVRRLTLDDAPFILALVNEPGWLRWIGDRDVHSLEDARRYLRDGPLASYASHGHGLCHVALLDGTPVGICGILSRPGLDAPDLGYAILAEHAGQGLATEAARATLDHARLGRSVGGLGLGRVLAITEVGNVASQRVLEKIGMRRDGTVRLPDAQAESARYTTS